MAVGCQHENNHFGVINFINEAMLLRDATNPQPRAVAGKRFASAVSRFPQ